MIGKGRPRFVRLRAHFTYRKALVGVGLLGVSCIVGGLIIAFGSRNALPPLVAGVALVAVAVVGSFPEINARYHGAELIARQSVIDAAQIAKHLEDLSESTSVTEDVKKELESLKHEVGRLTSGVATIGRTGTVSSGGIASLLGGEGSRARKRARTGAEAADAKATVLGLDSLLTKMGPSYIAFHEKKSSSVLLRLVEGSTLIKATAIVCSVTDPRGRTHGSEVLPAEPSVEVDFPTDFPTTDNLEPGRYFVDWLEGNAMFPSSVRLSYATDAFEID